jgi:hypothetical protein
MPKCIFVSVVFVFFITSYYLIRDTKHPCFGANTGISSYDWWSVVIKQTYLTTEGVSTQLSEQELNTLLPALTKTLYNDVFGSAAGWMLAEDAEYTLQKLAEWRDQGGGPKLAVISNFDERLNTILKGSLRKYH